MLNYRAAPSTIEDVGGSKKGWEIGRIPANGSAIAALAQLVEHFIRNEGVVGSNPISGTIFSIKINTLQKPKAKVFASFVV